MRIYDAHAHCGKWPFAGFKDDTEFPIEVLRKYNIEKCIISSALAIVYDMVKGNAQMVDLITTHDELLGYIVLNPNYLELSKKELEKYAQNPKVVGVKIHPYYCAEPFGSAASTELLEMISEYQLPILVHTHADPWSSPACVGRVAKQFPQQMILMGHGGLTNFEEGIEVAARHENIFIETCGSPIPAGKIDRAVNKLGSKKILYGSDIALLSPAFALGAVLDADISESQREDILYRNAYQLFEN